MVSDWRERKRLSLEKALDPTLAELLAIKMSNLSEEFYCASWLIGLEYALWEIMQGGDRRFALGELTEAEIGELQHLSDQAGGWWHWIDGVEPGDSGEIFMTLDEWRLHYERVRAC